MRGAQGSALPTAPLASAGTGGFGVYVHVPFCASRCGYCDFNTYTVGDPDEREAYVTALYADLELARRTLCGHGGGGWGSHRGGGPPQVTTVFFGGGTPTMLAAEDLARILERIDALWPLAGDAEVTTEANPETVTPASLAALRSAGFTRISFGMQSTAPHVLALLDRRHAPGRAEAAVGEAIEAGFEHVSVDLIYGTPGESAGDFAASLAAALASGIDHLSAYSLIVEESTRLGARMRRGEVPYPDDDVAADRYLLAEQMLTDAGFQWYEVSNWARDAGGRCHHNLTYWSGGDWWGFGPGAHSHVAGVRWWNVKHPAAYRAALAAGAAPVEGSEVLTADDRHIEAVLLGVRLAEGLPASVLRPGAVREAQAAVAEGLLEAAAWRAGRVVLTLRGRLLADAVVRRLIP
ncbi:MAG: coproporphyrinogen III oxidase [Micromonosporaceae bacterium]|nr:coproporphyrinogen III oxidase [Micromonosporaceae bacterium]